MLYLPFSVVTILEDMSGPVCAPVVGLWVIVVAVVEVVVAAPVWHGDYF